MEERKIDIGEITKLHTATFKLETNLGPITLKALSRKVAKRVGTWLMLQFPEYAELATEFQFLKDISAYPEGLTLDQAARLAELYQLLDEWTTWFYLPCFVDPKLNDIDEYEALTNELDTESFEQLEAMLEVLANPMPASEANRQIAEICLEYGVPLADGISADNITVQQTAIIDEARLAENERIAKIMEAEKLGHSG